LSTCPAESLVRRWPARQTDPLSLHDALPICVEVTVLELPLRAVEMVVRVAPGVVGSEAAAVGPRHGDAGRHAPPPRGLRHGGRRSEEHTSELQSRVDLVYRLPLETKINKLDN